MIIVLALLGLYFLLNIYNLAWLFLPGFGKLRRIMAAYKVGHLRMMLDRPNAYINRRQLRTMPGKENSTSSTTKTVMFNCSSTFWPLAQECPVHYGHWLSLTRTLTQHVFQNWW